MGTVLVKTRGEAVGGDASRVAGVLKKDVDGLWDLSPLLEAPSLPKLQTVECPRAHCFLLLFHSIAKMVSFHLMTSNLLLISKCFYPAPTSNYRLIPNCPPDICA